MLILFIYLNLFLLPYFLCFCTGGGAIYAIRGTVVKVSAPMCKIVIESSEMSPERKEGNGTAAVPVRPTSLTVSGGEAQVLHRVLDGLRQKIVDGIDKADELKLSSLLEDLDCEGAIAQALLVSALPSTTARFTFKVVNIGNFYLVGCKLFVQAMERGCEVHLNEAQMREAQQIQAKVQVYSQVVARKLMEEHTAHLQVKLIQYVYLVTRT